jgi:hypothetical protein
MRNTQVQEDSKRDAVYTVNGHRITIQIKLPPKRKESCHA